MASFARVNEKIRKELFERANTNASSISDWMKSLKFTDSQILEVKSLLDSGNLSGLQKTLGLTDVTASQTVVSSSVSPTASTTSAPSVLKASPSVKTDPIPTVVSPLLESNSVLEPKEAEVPHLEEVSWFKDLTAAAKEAIRQDIHLNLAAELAYQDFVWGYADSKFQSTSIEALNKAANTLPFDSFKESYSTFLQA